MYEHLTVKKGRTFYTPEDLMAEAIKYFEWCVASPLIEEKVFVSKGEVVRANSDKVRPFTKNGFATFAGMPTAHLERYRKKGARWEDVIQMIEQVMYDQKFSNAVAGLMNPMMIKSELGMVDRNEVTGKDGGAIQTHSTNAEEALLDEARRLGIDIGALGLGTKTDV